MAVITKSIESHSFAYIYIYIYIYIFTFGIFPNTEGKYPIYAFNIDIFRMKYFYFYEGKKKIVDDVSKRMYRELRRNFIKRIEVFTGEVTADRSSTEKNNWLR